MNITATTDNYITEFDTKWNSIGVPMNVPIDISDIIVRYDGTDYNWTEVTDLVNVPIVDPNVYGWNCIPEYVYSSCRHHKARLCILDVC